MARKGRKHLDFELNLIPFIDLLSTCICFLLITAVWINVGSMNVKQAVGGQPAAETEKKPVVWAQLETSGALNLEVQDSSHVPAQLRKLKLPGTAEGRPNYDQLAQTVAQLKQLEPTLSTALIQPQAQSAYEDIIELMDHLKKGGMIDLGVAPL